MYCCFFTLQSVLAQTAERNYIMRQSVLDEQETYAVTQVEYYDAVGQTNDDYVLGIII